MTVHDVAHIELCSWRPLNSELKNLSTGINDPNADVEADRSLVLGRCSGGWLKRVTLSGRVMPWQISQQGGETPPAYVAGDGKATPAFLPSESVVDCQTVGS